MLMTRRRFQIIERYPDGPATLLFKGREFQIIEGSPNGPATLLMIGREFQIIEGSPNVLFSLPDSTLRIQEIFLQN